MICSVFLQLGRLVVGHLVRQYLKIIRLTQVVPVIVHRTGNKSHTGYMQMGITEPG